MAIPFFPNFIKNDRAKRILFCGLGVSFAAAFLFVSASRAAFFGSNGKWGTGGSLDNVSENVADAGLADGEEIPPHVHEYVSTVVENADYGKNGRILYTCDCGDSYTELIPALSETQTLSSLSVETFPNWTIGSEEYVSCSIRFERVGGEETARLSGQIRVRGNSTAGPEKKPYKIKLDAEYALIDGCAASKKWVLLACVFDISMIRDSLALYAASLLDGIGWSSSFEYVEVSVNGVYRGVYLLCEQIDTGEDKVDVKEDGSLETGFLIEQDGYSLTDGSVEGRDYFTVSLYGGVFPYSVKGKGKTQAQVAYMQEETARLHRAMNAAVEEEVRAIVDIDSAVDIYLLQLVVSDPDINWSSFYISKEKNGLFRFTAPWDFDLSFGNYDGYEDCSPDLTNDLFAGLRQSEWFNELLKARWNQMEEEGFSEKLLSYILAVNEKYGKVFALNDARWRVYETLSQGKISSAQSDETLSFACHDDAVNSLYGWLAERLSILDERFS